VGAIDFKTNIAGATGLFAPTGRSYYGKQRGGKISRQDSAASLAIAIRLHKTDSGLQTKPVYHGLH
jgi:hypothetical protein